MAAPKTKTREQLLSRRRRISEMYLAGNTMARIGKQLSLSPATIHRDVEWAREQWHTKAAEAIEPHINLELAQIDQAEREAWIAWDRSIGMHITATLKDTTVDDVDAHAT